MIPVFKFHFDFGSKIKWPQATESIFEKLSSLGCSTDITDFYFEMSENIGRNSFDRIKKIDKEFSEYQNSDLIISSFGCSRPFSVSLRKNIRVVLSKIGRSIPLHNSLFFLEQNSWNGTTRLLSVSENDIFNKQVPRNGIVLSNDWWISGRVLSFAAMVLPEVESNSLGVSQKLGNIINSLGKVRKKEFIVYPEEHEKRIKFHLGQNNPHEYSCFLNTIAENLVKENKLELDIGNSQEERVTGFSRKKIITNKIKDLGFKPINSESSKGCLLYSKKTDLNNYNSLFFDFGSYHPQCDVWLRVQGPLWSYSLQLPYINDTKGAEISNPHEFDKAISNVRNIVEASKELIDMIESKHGVSPGWFRLYE